jgi:hypothetical protein
MNVTIWMLAFCTAVGWALTERWLRQRTQERVDELEKSIARSVADLETIVDAAEKAPADGGEEG